MNLKHLLIFAALLLSEIAKSQPAYQIPAGTRPRSMGEAFVAVADDGNAIRWNPAGLARMERIQASFAYANLFGLNIHNSYASFLTRAYFIPSLTDYLSFGVDWHGFNTLDEKAQEDDLDFAQNEFNLALAFRPPQSLSYVKHLSLGVNAKHFRQNGSWDGKQENNLKAWGWEAGLLYDLGALRRVPPGLHFGLMVHDINGTFAKHKTSSKEKILPENLRWGLSYRPFESWPGNKLPISEPVLALDIDDRVHLGLEFWLARTLALRAGWQKDRHTKESPTLSFGLGLRANLKEWPEARMDYALTEAPGVLNTPTQFGGALIFKNNPRLIRIEEAHIEDVFASLYLHYGERGARVGTVKLKNYSEHEALQARVTFIANQYMLPQQPDTVVIEPRQTHDFSLRAVFEPEILEAREGRLTGEVRIIYDYQKAEHASRAAVDFAIYSQSFLTWDDPCKAAAFVTSNDPLVAEFVEAVRSSESDSTKVAWFTRYERGEAVKLYHALQAYNIEYRLDQKTPFPSLHGAGYRRDQITYPAKFLSREKRYGDCDDLAVLYASLLQHAGFSTALVSVPGHLLMMFDTEIDTAQHRTLPLPPKLFVPYQGSLWIPVETTMIPHADFVAAWQAAVDSFEVAENWEIFEVAACQTQYRPPRLASSDRTKLSIPDFSYRLEKNLLALETMKQDYFRSFEDSLNTVPALARSEEIERRNHYGVIFAENGEYERALQQFELIRRVDPAFAPAWNNRGNVEFIQGRFAPARASYDSALARYPFSRGTYLNLAILYQMMVAGAAKDSAGYYRNKSFEKLLHAAQYLEGDSLAAHQLLGITEERTEGKAKPVLPTILWMKKVRHFVDRNFRKFAIGRKEIGGVPLETHATKGRGQTDPDRGFFLYWDF